MENHYELFVERRAHRAANAKLLQFDSLAQTSFCRNRKVLKLGIHLDTTLLPSPAGGYEYSVPRWAPRYVEIEICFAPYDLFLL